MFTKKSFLSFALITLIAQNLNALPRLFITANKITQAYLTKPTNINRASKAKDVFRFAALTVITKYTDDDSANMIYDNIKIARMNASCWITNTKAFKWITSWFEA